MTKDINYLVLSYPNFVLGTVIDPEEANQNNKDITDKINEFIDDVEEAWNNADAAVTTATNVQTDYTVMKPALETAKVNADTATSNANTAATNANTAADNANNVASTVSNTLLASNQSMYRQALINGNFDVWQRGVVFNSIANNAYSADRWQASWNGTTTMNISRQGFSLGQTEVPNNPNFYAEIHISAASGQTFAPFFTQQIEDGVALLNNKTVTLSFWAKSNAARTIEVNFKQYFGTGTGGSSPVDISGGLVNLTTTWSKYSCTVTLPSIAGKVWSNNYDPRLFVMFLLPINTVCTIDIAQTQLNIGDTALPFMPKSFSQELHDCMRYYEKSYEYGTYAGTSTDVGVFQFCIGATGGNQKSTRISYQTPKRITPIVTTYSTTGVQNKISTLDASGSVVLSTYNGVQAQQSASGFLLAIADAAYAGFKFHWTADAEL